MIQVSARHLEIFAHLRDLPVRTWGESALLGCLGRLQDGGPTEAREVQVEDGWPVEDGFCLVYESPWGPTVGFRAVRQGRQLLVHEASEITPQEFGAEVADFSVAEPLGSRSYNMKVDPTGMGWWGDPPFPHEI